MMAILKLIKAVIFGGHNERIDGSGLFCGEYTKQQQFVDMAGLFGDHPFMRMPYRRDGYQAFKQSAMNANLCGIETIALLDQFDNNSAMMNCLNSIKTEMPFIKHIELFNELPHMQYPGQQIGSLEELVIRTNTYSDWIHQNIPGVKVISMAPYNSIDERSFDAWNGVTNTKILKNLILYTTTDISAIHIYGDSFSKRRQMISLADNLKAWNKEAQYKKEIWVTETGVDGWKYHERYYHGMVRLAVNVLKPEKIIWYRQTIDKMTSPDSSFALECRCKDDVHHSPLWSELI